MGGGLLSQDDINALLMGSDFSDTSSDSSSAVSAAVETPAVQDMGVSPKKDYNLSHLKKIVQHFNDSGKSVISTIIGTDIDSSVSSVDFVDSASAKAKIAGKRVALYTNFNAGFSGKFGVYVDLELGGVLADLMTGNGDGSVPPAEITELHESAINEAINQMIASGLTAISGELNKISLSTDIPQVKVVEINEGFSDEILEGDCAVAELKFSLMQYTDKPLYFVFKQDTVDSINEKYEPKTEAAAAKVAATAGAATQQESKEAQSKENQANSQKNMMLLLDVPLSVSVILGKSKMLMKDILNLGIGSIIELDKSASEPVDLAVNTKPIARGEVVVVDENFGLRITEIVSPLERLDIIKKEK